MNKGTLKHCPAEVPALAHLPKPYNQVLLPEEEGLLRAPKSGLVEKLGGEADYLVACLKQ